MTQDREPTSTTRQRPRVLGAAVFAASLVALALAVPLARRLWRAGILKGRSRSTLTHGTPCPNCGTGWIVFVESYRRAPNKEYPDLRGPVGAARTRYRCSEGCTWVEQDEPQGDTDA